MQGGNLSLGMQKMTILLRGIFRNGKIIVFDEPLSGLDSKSRKKFMHLMEEKCQHKTVIVITHDSEIISYMDRTINLNHLKKN